jgi:RLL motif-containing protein 1
LITQNCEIKIQAKISDSSFTDCFLISDYVSNDVAKIVRLLHIHELRDLQTCINEAIVAVQALTANPKTDQRLGKVGR